MWDWDEALFALGVRSYDVTHHHPHPPGFPLYVALGKLFRLFFHSDFHALQAINILAAIALFPLLLWLALELRFPFRTAYLGSLLFVFLPNVWFYGGTAFSDIPALALTIAGCAALLRGSESRRAYFAGALLLALAAAIREQALFVGIAPALYATWRRKNPRDLAVAAAIGLAVLVVAYGGAALASSSVSDYVVAVMKHRRYVRDVDTFLSPLRPPILTLFPNYFLRAIPGGNISIVMFALSVVSLIVAAFRRTFGVWMLVAMFLPFNIAAWFLLDTNSISRYAMGYAPMYALLAVDAIGLLTMPVQIAVVIFAIARFVSWTVPEIREVRKTIAPPVALMQWARVNLPPQPVWIHDSILAFTDYYLPEYESREEIRIGDRGWLLTEGATADSSGINFVRRRGHLARIARVRYFEASAAPITGEWRFVRGWYDAEGSGDQVWRWMGSRSETLLPPIGGNAQLTLEFDLPTELVPRHPAVDIYVNGQHVDHLVCTTKSNVRTIEVPSRGDAWNALVITIDKVLNPAKEHILPDPRDLGLELTRYGWDDVSQSSTRPESNPRLNHVAR